VCGLPATFVGASEVALAFFGAAATAIVVTFSPLPVIAAGSSVFPASGSFGVDSAVVLGLLVTGVILLGVGIVEWVRSYRALSKED